MRLWCSGRPSCARGSTMPDGHSVPDVLRQHRPRAEALLRVPSTLHRTLCKRCAMHSHKIGTFFLAPCVCGCVCGCGCVCVAVWLCAAVCVCVCARGCVCMCVYVCVGELRVTPRRNFVCSYPPKARVAALANTLGITEKRVRVTLPHCSSMVWRVPMADISITGARLVQEPAAEAGFGEATTTSHIASSQATTTSHIARSGGKHSTG